MHFVSSTAMHSIRTLSFIYFVLYVFIDVLGNAIPEITQNGWKPIIPYATRINSRRSYDTREITGSTASSLIQPSGSSQIQPSTSSDYKRSSDIQEETGRTLESPSWSQSSETYRIYDNRDIGKTQSHPPSKSAKPNSRSSYRRSLDVQDTKKSTPSQTQTIRSTMDSPASFLRKSDDTRAETVRAFSSNFIQDFLNILKSITQNNYKDQQTERTSTSLKLSPPSRNDVPETTQRTPNPQSSTQEEESEKLVSSSGWFLSSESAEYLVLKSVFDDCLNSGDSVNCLKSKTVTFLDRVSRMKHIPLFEGISLARLRKSDIQPTVIKDADIEGSLGRDLVGKSDHLDQMIYDRLINFWNSHTIEVDFSAQSVEEGRGKEKKLIGYIITALASAAATVGPLAFKGLAAFAFKALVAAKMALVLSSLLALKSLSEHGGGGHRSIIEVSDDSYFLKPQTRSLHVPTEKTHRMAYGAQLQKPIVVV